MKNDGWTDLEYNLCECADTNKRLSILINESCHVFRCHPDGNWKTHDKPAFAKLYAVEIKERPFLIRRLLSLGETYAAIELNKQGE